MMFKMIRRSCLAVQFFSLGLMIASYILFCFYVHLFIYLIIYLFIYSCIHLFVCLFTLFWLYMAWVSFSEKFFHIFSMQIFFFATKTKNPSSSRWTQQILQGHALPVFWKYWQRVIFIFLLMMRVVPICCSRVTSYVYGLVIKGYFAIFIPLNLWKSALE